MNWDLCKFWAVFAIFLLSLGVPAFFIGRWLEIDIGLVYLGIVIAVYVVMSLTVGYMRRRMRSDLEKRSAAEQELLGASSPDVRYAMSSKEGPSVQATLWVGLICINGALLPLFLGPLGIYQLILDGKSDIIGGLLLGLGFVMAWGWWSVGVTIWRRWAARRGVDQDEIQYLGQNASLLWPEGHFFEKTELGHILERWRRK